MATLPTASDVADSVEQSDNILLWINDILATSGRAPQSSVDLLELDQHIQQILVLLDVAYDDSSSQLEQAIIDISRTVPRLVYNLHIMRDTASSLQSSLAETLRKTREAVLDTSSTALDRLRYLDTIKSRMESSRDVLREAESWSVLELEVTALLTEKNYAKGAERLSEANRSLIVFQNTPEYDTRRMLMVNLQNQLEASLSTALVSAINTQDLPRCQQYFSIFMQIQRESEFRNYYNAARRIPLLNMWNNFTPDAPNANSSAKDFMEFLPKFYDYFLSIIQLERVSIPIIFPDPAVTLSAFISSTLAALQPSFSQRISILITNHDEPVLPFLMSLLKSTESFAIDVEKLMEKIIHNTVSVPQDGQNSGTLPISSPRLHTRRRSSRLSISWRPGSSTTLETGNNVKPTVDGMDWDQELFQPFLELQIEYGALERRLLDQMVHKVVEAENTRKYRTDLDRARLLRERSIDVFTSAESSLSRCIAFTHGYGALGLVQALDGVFEAFLDIWTADVQFETSKVSVVSNPQDVGDDLSDMDYTAEDWSHFQMALRLLSSARAVYERIATFEERLRSTLAQIAMRFRLAHSDTKFTVAPCKGEYQLLEQSPLNSADLHTLLNSVDGTSQIPSSVLSPTALTLRHSYTSSHLGRDQLLIRARSSVFNFARTCQISLQETILSPLYKNLKTYPSSPLWIAQGDPTSRYMVTEHDLHVPSFSLSPSDTIQRVAEGLLNLPRLFEVYAGDDSLAFSLHTLPHVDDDTQGFSESYVNDPSVHPAHARRISLSTAKPSVDADAVSSTWLLSLGNTLLNHLTTKVLPSFVTLSTAGSAQLASDLDYLTNILQALNVEFQVLDEWKSFLHLGNEEGKQKFLERDPNNVILATVGRLRGWGEESK